MNKRPYNASPKGGAKRTRGAGKHSVPSPAPAFLVVGCLRRGYRLQSEVCARLQTMSRRRCEEIECQWLDSDRVLEQRRIELAPVEKVVGEIMTERIHSDALIGEQFDAVRALRNRVRELEQEIARLKQKYEAEEPKRKLAIAR